MLRWTDGKKRGCGDCGRSTRCEFLAFATRRWKAAPEATPAAPSEGRDSGSTRASADGKRHIVPKPPAMAKNSPPQPRSWACPDTGVLRRDCPYAEWFRGRQVFACGLSTQSAGNALSFATSNGVSSRTAGVRRESTNTAVATLQTSKASDAMLDHAAPRQE